MLSHNVVVGGHFGDCRKIRLSNGCCSKQSRRGGRGDPDSSDRCCSKSQPRRRPRWAWTSAQYPGRTKYSCRRLSARRSHNAAASSTYHLFAATHLLAFSPWVAATAAASIPWTSHIELSANKRGTNVSDVIRSQQDTIRNLLEHIPGRRHTPNLSSPGHHAGSTFYHKPPAIAGNPPLPVSYRLR
jgi:hypothetical protein